MFLWLVLTLFGQFGFTEFVGSVTRNGVCLLAMGLSTIVESLFTSVLGQVGLWEVWGGLVLFVAFIMGS